MKISLCVGWQLSTFGDKISRSDELVDVLLFCLNISAVSNEREQKTKI